MWTRLCTYCKGGKTTAEIDLSAYAGQAVCLDMTPYMDQGDELDITAVMEKNKDLIQKGDIIVLYTGYEDLVGKMEYFDYKDFNGNTGEILEKYGCKGIGFDMSSIDRSGRGAPVRAQPRDEHHRISDQPQAADRQAILSQRRAFEICGRRRQPGARLRYYRGLKAVPEAEELKENHQYGTEASVFPYENRHL